jgi:hypothetical protein
MKLTLVVLSFISLAGLAIFVARILPARASSNPRSEPVAAESCMDRYNYLVKSAKAALIAGDRAATVNLLSQAERIIPSCPALQDGASPQAAMLSLNRRHDASVVTNSPVSLSSLSAKGLFEG